MIKFIKRVLINLKRALLDDYSNTIESYESFGEGKKEFVPKWGIIIPHTAKSKGAALVEYDEASDSRDVIANEYDYAVEMASSTTFPYAFRDGIGVSGAAKALRKFDLNCSLEPHLNAFNRKAAGYEILVLWGDTLSEKYALKFLDAFAEKYPDRKNRGIKKLVNEKDRGYRNLINAKKQGMEVALLSEMFFIDNKDEWIDPDEMAEFWEEVLND